MDIGLHSKSKMVRLASLHHFGTTLSCMVNWTKRVLPWRDHLDRKKICCEFLVMIYKMVRYHLWSLVQVMHVKTVQVYDQINFEKGSRKILWIIPGVSLILFLIQSRYWQFSIISLSKLEKLKKLREMWLFRTGRIRPNASVLKNKPAAANTCKDERCIQTSLGQQTNNQNYRLCSDGEHQSAVAYLILLQLIMKVSF